MAESSGNDGAAQTRSLEQRIAELEAVRAIEALKYRYWRACDAKDPVTFRKCFIRRGAIIDYGPMGQFDDADDITAVFIRIALSTDDDGQPLILDMHHGMHPDITVLDATSARGSWSMRIRQIDVAQRTEKVSSIEYEDTYLVEGGAWLMSSTRARVLWSMTTPLGDEVRLDIPDTAALTVHV